MANLLKEKHDVTIIDNLSRGKYDEDIKELIEHKNIVFQQRDLNTYSQLQSLETDFEYIFHLAARNGTINFYEFPYEVARTNTLTLMHMLDWMGQNCKPKKFIWTSSSEVYATTPNIPIPTPELTNMTINDPFNPRLSYAASKILGEVLVTSYAKTYDLNFTIVRPHNIYGPRMGYDHVIPEFIKRILSKEDPFTIYGGQETRSFCYIDDFLDGLTKVSFYDNGNNIYHLGNPTETKIMDLAYLLFEILKYHPKIKILPTLKGSCMRRCPDITKVSKLGYIPKVSLKEGLLKTYNWYSHVE